MVHLPDVNGIVGTIVHALAALWWAVWVLDSVGVAALKKAWATMVTVWQ